ncbi:adenosine deaminase [Nanoarchaeota archaeon]
MREYKIDDKSYLDKLSQRQVFPLHIHWDGSIPAEAVFARAQHLGIDLKLPDVDFHGRPVRYGSAEEQVIHDPQSLKSFMTDLRSYRIGDVFGTVIGLMRDPKGLAWAADAHCRYLKGQNIPYSETRFAPQYHASDGFSIEDVMRCSIDSFHEAKLIHDVDVRLIICLGRESDVRFTSRIVDDVIRCNRDHPDMVLGIDLACEENGNPPQKHLKAFKKTLGTPLKRTVHAGEMCDEDTNLFNIFTALYILRPDAISQAIPIHRDPMLVEEMARRNIRLESNPISNHVFFNHDIEDLHLDSLLEQGVPVTISPDDPAMIPDGDLHHNLYHLGKLYGDGFVKQVIRNSIECSWGLSEEDKKRYLKDIE